MGAADIGSGRAALIALDLDRPDIDGPLHQVFLESPACPSPIAACHALRGSIEADFPGRTWGVLANERARFLEWRARMAALLGPDEAAYTPAAFTALPSVAALNA